MKHLMGIITLFFLNYNTYSMDVLTNLQAMITDTDLLVQRHPASVKNQIRQEHAQELMGDRYHESVVKYDGSNYRFEKQLYEDVEKSLQKKWKHMAEPIALTIINESYKHKFDPYFLMAVITNESSFKVLARGHSGEIGLMQIMPQTGKWLAKKFNIKWEGKKTLRNPITNIQLGAAYLASLRNKYKSYGRLYLAAYNMGPGNVKKALRKKVVPRDYTYAVMKHYLSFYENISSEI